MYGPRGAARLLCGVAGLREPFGGAGQRSAHDPASDLYQVPVQRSFRASALVARSAVS